MRRPYYKQPHKAWYVNLKGRPIRSAGQSEGEEAAWKRYDAPTQPVDRVVEVVYQHIRKRRDHLKEGLGKATGEVA